MGFILLWDEEVISGSKLLERKMDPSRVFFFYFVSLASAFALMSAVEEISAFGPMKVSSL